LKFVIGKIQRTEMAKILKTKWQRKKRDFERFPREKPYPARVKV
jgi:hypothetical protein